MSIEIKSYFSGWKKLEKRAADSEERAQGYTFMWDSEVPELFEEVDVFMKKQSKLMIMQQKKKLKILLKIGFLTRLNGVGISKKGGCYEHTEG